MTYVYIHYTASIVMADLFFWPEYPFKLPPCHGNTNLVCSNIVDKVLIYSISEAKMKLH